MSSNSIPRTSSGKAARPKKPKGFPLYAHKQGRWAKKVRGKTVYFASWVDDPKGVAALEQWLEQKDELLAGRKPRAKADDLVVRDLLNQFLTSKREQVESSELTVRGFAEYLATCETIAKVFGRSCAVDGLEPSDFAALRRMLAKRNGPVRLGNEVQRVRTIFRWGREQGLIQEVRFGSAFKKPARRVLRKARNEAGPRMLEAAEIRRLLDAADVQLRAMILLAMNCGLGNSDCGRLETRHLKDGWLDYPRGKTGIGRRCPLWPETVEALGVAIAERPKGKAGLVFITKYGNAWTRDARMTDDDDRVRPAVDAVCGAFGKLLRRLGLKRPGIGFYCLRHVFQTIGSRTRDELAVSTIMGHARDDMASVYREGLDDDRLLAVTEHVRAWLFGEAPDDAPGVGPRLRTVEAEETEGSETETDTGPRLRLFG